MKLLQLKRVFVFRSILSRQVDQMTEAELQILYAIDYIDSLHKRCSGNKLLILLNTKKRTQNKKRLLFQIRQFRAKGFVIVTGKGPLADIRLSQYGKNCLYEIERALRKVRS